MKKIKMVKILLAAILLLVFTPCILQAADVTLAWDPPIPADSVTGYNLYWGTAHASYPNKVDVANVLTYVITGLASGTYYFAATAYNQYGESDYSNEVSTTIKPVPPLPSRPPQPRNFRIITVTPVPGNM